MDADRSLTTTFTTPRFLFGVAAIVFGFLFLGDELRWFRMEPILDWWPIVLVALGLFKLVSGSTGWGVFAMAAGGLLLANNLHASPIGVFEAVLPLGLLAFGTAMVVNAVRGPAVRRIRESERTSAVSVMGGVSRTARSQVFRYGDAVAVMGGTSLDLRGARLAPEGGVLDVVAFWGVVEVVVPRGWDVECQVMPVWAGVEDETKPAGPGDMPPPDFTAPADGPGTATGSPATTAGGASGTSLDPGQPPRLLVRGVAVMGAVTIAHEPDKS